LCLHIYRFSLNYSVKTGPGKLCNTIDSSTFSLSLKRHKWATFRQTKSGVKLHLNYCYMYDTTMYPTDFTLTNAHEHDLNQLPVLVNQPEATYVFDRGY
ncbi:transposase, partial [Enterococcus faecium]